MIRFAFDTAPCSRYITRPLDVFVLPCGFETEHDEERCQFRAGS